MLSWPNTNIPTGLFVNESLNTATFQESMLTLTDDVRNSVLLFHLFFKTQINITVLHHVCLYQ